MKKARQRMRKNANLALRLLIRITTEPGSFLSSRTEASNSVQRFSQEELPSGRNRMNPKCYLIRFPSPFSLESGGDDVSSLVYCFD